jgi:hypothetical protein
VKSGHQGFSGEVSGHQTSGNQTSGVGAQFIARKSGGFLAVDHNGWMDAGRQHSETFEATVAGDAFL